MQTDDVKLQICNNCVEFMQSIQTPIKALQKEIEERNSLLQTLKIGVMPNDCFKNITTPIIL